MRYFLDTEFNEEIDPVKLISLAVVAEDGRELYVTLEPAGWQPRLCNEWVKKNVIPQMDLCMDGKALYFGLNEAALKCKLQYFVAGDEKPEWWGYFAAYDWYLVCRLFGSFEKMPKRWPNYCLDVRQLADHKGVLRLKDAVRPEAGPEHHALVDARWIKRAWTYLNTLPFKDPTR